MRERQSRDALVGAEERIKKILESTTDGFVSVDNEMRIMYFNSAAEKILSRNQHEVLGMNLFDAFPQIKGSFFEDKFYKSISHGKKCCFEDFFGEPPHETWYCFRIIPDSNEVSIFLRNITSAKKTARMLSEKEKKYRLMAENAKDIITTHDKDGICTYASPYLEKLLGYHPKELLGKNSFEIIHPDYHDIIIRKKEELYLNGGSARLEYRLKRKNGEFIWVESIANLVNDADGNFQHFIIITRDFRDRKEYEKVLNESELYYRTIFENSGAATVIIEENKIISLVNSEFERLYGLPKEEIEGKLRCTSFVHPDCREMMGQYHSQRISNHESVPRNYEFKFIDHQQKTKDIFITVSVIPGTKKAMLSLMDISRRKKAIKRLKWELKVNESLNKVYAPLVSSQTGLDDIASVILTQAMELTGSASGFVAEVIPGTKNMLILSMVPPLHNKYYFSRPVIRISESGTQNSLMSYSLDKKESFFTNDTSKHPLFRKMLDHLPVKKFLSVPVLNEGVPVGQISLSNPQRDYSENDLEALERLADFYTLALQRVGNEKKIKESLEEKKVLLREIHHRVKNNLQIISSLLNLQSQYLEDEKAQDVFFESRNRVKSMALIHEKLYRSSSLARINFEEYVENLSESLLHSYAEIPGNIKIKIDVQNVYLNVETSIPCGLIINELISNSLKHAFKEGEGTINIKMHPKNEYYILNVCDNGIGFPEDLDFRNTESLGMQLVNSLAFQLEGDVNLIQDRGTCFNINFKELSYKKRI